MCSDNEKQETFKKVPRSSYFVFNRSSRIFSKSVDVKGRDVLSKRVSQEPVYDVYSDVTLLHVSETPSFLWFCP